MSKLRSLATALLLSWAVASWAASGDIKKHAQKELHKELHWWINDDTKEKKEKPDKAYGKLIGKLAKEYSKSIDGWIYDGELYNGQKIAESQKEAHVPASWENDNRWKDFYTERFHSMGKKIDAMITHTPGDVSVFPNREIFYQELMLWRWEEKYGSIIKNNKAYKIYDTIEPKDFDGIIKKTETSKLIGVKDNEFFKMQYWADFKVYLAKRPPEEKMLWLLPEHYYTQIKDRKFYKTYGTLLHKPSEETMEYAEKHWFVLKPKLLVLRNAESYDVAADQIELRWIYIRVPEKKSETLVQYDDAKATLAQVKETEKQMNELFNYGRKEIFESNKSEFNSKRVTEWLDELFEMLQKNPALKIKVTGYSSWADPKLPLDRAEKVKKYLIHKGIGEERIQTQWSKERLAQSIKIET